MHHHDDNLRKTILQLVVGVNDNFNIYLIRMEEDVNLTIVIINFHESAHFFGSNHYITYW